VQVKELLRVGARLQDYSKSCGGVDDPLAARVLQVASDIVRAKSVSALQPQVARWSLACVCRGCIAGWCGVLDGTQEGLDCQSLVTLVVLFSAEAKDLVIVLFNSCLSSLSCFGVIGGITIILILPLEDAQVRPSAGEEMAGGKREAHVGDMR